MTIARIWRQRVVRSKPRSRTGPCLKFPNPCRAPVSVPWSLRMHMAHCSAFCPSATSCGRSGRAVFTRLDDPASSHMTINVITVTEDVTVLDAVELMNTGRFRHMPIMKDGRVDGIISIGDVVKFRLAEIEQEQSAMREYIATV